MIPLGHKKFDSFVEICNNMDWHQVVSNDRNVDEATIKANVVKTTGVSFLFSINSISSCIVHSIFISFPLFFYKHYSIYINLIIFFTVRIVS